jgi:hypothetical protein
MATTDEQVTSLTQDNIMSHTNRAIKEKVETVCNQGAQSLAVAGIQINASPTLISTALFIRSMIDALIRIDEWLKLFLSHIGNQSDQKREQLCEAVFQELNQAFRALVALLYGGDAKNDEVIRSHIRNLVQQTSISCVDATLLKTPALCEKKLKEIHSSINYFLSSKAMVESFSFGNMGEKNTHLANIFGIVLSVDQYLHGDGAVYAKWLTASNSSEMQQRDLFSDAAPPTRKLALDLDEGVSGKGDNTDPFASKAQQRNMDLFTGSEGEAKVDGKVSGGEAGNPFDAPPEQRSISLD